MLRYRIVDRCGAAGKSHRDGNRRDVHRIHEEVGVTRYAYVGTAIYQRTGVTGRYDGDGNVVRAIDTANARASQDMCDADDGRRGGSA